MKKRILSLLLTLVMILGMLPATSLPAFAAASYLPEGGSGTKDDPFLIRTKDQWQVIFDSWGGNGTSFDGQYVKLLSDIVATDYDDQYYLDINVSSHLDMNGHSLNFPIKVEDGKVVELTGNGSVESDGLFGNADWAVNDGTLIINGSFTHKKFGDVRNGTLIVNGSFKSETSSFGADITIWGDGKIILNHPEAKIENLRLCNGAEAIIKQGTVSNLTGKDTSSFIMYGGRLEDDLRQTDDKTKGDRLLKLAFYGGEIAPSTVYQYKSDYTEYNIVYSQEIYKKRFTVTNTSYALFEDGTTKTIASYEDLVDAIMSYGKFSVYAPCFEEQSVAVSGGSADLGTIQAASYPITFKGNKVPVVFYADGCRAYETLKVYDSNNKLVDECSNDTQNGEGLTYDLNRLPQGTYTIVEEVTLVDKNGQELLSEENKIVVNWKPVNINNVNVSATFSGTPANATSNTDGITVTSTKWYKKNGSSWTQLGASDTFKEGNTYRCEVTVGATGTYTLADGYTVKINGTAATKKSGNTWYRDVTITGYTSYVDVYDIALPEAGVHPDFTYNDVDCYRSSVALVEWFECDKDGKKLSGALSADYKFKEDAYYRLEVTAVPDTNYLFDTRNLDFFIGSKAVQYYYPYQDTTYPNSVTGWKVYHVDDANGTYTVQIGDITLKDGDYLANNATAVTTVKPSGGYAYYKDGVLTLNNFVAAKLVRYYERYLEVELIGENKIGAIADYYYWDGNASNNYYTGLEFRGDGDLEFYEYYGHPYCNVSVNGDVFFNGSGDILLDAEIYCFQYTDNVIINDGYVYCYTSQDSVFGDDTIIEVNGGKLQLLDGGSWDKFICNGTFTIAAGSVYVSADPRKIELEDCVPWDGVTDLNTYDCVWIVEEQATVTHTVTFKVDTTTVATKTVEDGKTVTAPADPTQSGKTFLGWYTDGGTKFDFTTPITGDITLTAKFEDATSTVKLGDVNGDDTIDYADIQCIYQHMSTDSKLTGDALIAADVNKDGAVDYGDIQRLYQHLSTDNKLS